MSAEEQDKAEFAEGELVFRTDIKDKPKWRTVPYFIGCGALLGLLLWSYYDRNVSWLHILGWVGGLALILGLIGLPIFRKKELKEFRIDAEGFKIIWAVGSQEYKWKELEAARFETYPVVNLHTDVHCFRFRVNGKNTEMIMDGLGDKGMRAFRIVMGRFLSEHEIPPECKELRSFTHLLALGGMLTFVVSAIGTIIAYVLFYRTLGVVFGTAIMATGAVIAFMTRRERISKYVLTASVVMVTSLIVMIWAFNINVGQTLRDWEKQERQLGRPPWTATTQADNNEPSRADGRIKNE
jgi:MFS family permease